MTYINDLDFSDIYVMPEGKVYIPDGTTPHGLRELSETKDNEKFIQEIEKTWQESDGSSSYSFNYEGYFYRVERTLTTTGIQYCSRKMPKTVPNFTDLGFPTPFVKYLYSLNRTSGLILWAGPTGQGKTTSISSLLKSYLTREGGYAYTIEDPPELPLDGIVTSKRGGLGLCKQTPVSDGKWGDALKSSLRSRPNYILVGEVRTPDTAGEVLRAATSGHLVLSTIHANNPSDALNSLVKYASAGEMSEDLAYDLMARGILGVVHQVLQGTSRKYPRLSYAFANPDTTTGDQMRSIIASGNLNLATTIDQQMTRMMNGDELFR